MEQIRREMETHIRALRRYAIALTHDVADADDMVQETLRRALDYVATDDDIDDWRAYLFKILHNVRNDHYLRRARGFAAVPLDQADIDSILCPPNQELRHECLQLARAVEMLSEEHREVLLLVALEGRSYREVAALLDLPIGTVMSRLSRARDTLRKYVAVGLDDERKDSG